MDVCPSKTKPVRYQLIETLQSSRDKLTPLVNDVIISTVDLIQKGDGKMFEDRVLTREQYQDMVRASAILKEAQCKLSVDSVEPRFEALPNTNVIVNRMTATSNNRQNPPEDDGILVDEPTIIALLEVYERIGVIIKRLSEETAPPTEETEITTTQKKGILHTTIKSPSGSVLIKSAGSMTIEPESDRTNFRKKKVATMDRGTVITFDQQTDVASLQELEPQWSTLSVRNENVLTSRPENSGSSGNEEDECKDNFKIKIMCNMSGSDMCGDDDPNVHYLSPVKSEQDCYRVKLGETPVSVKTAPEGGGTYCINAQTEDKKQEIKIIIKSCSDPSQGNVKRGVSSRILSDVEDEEEVTVVAKRSRNINESNDTKTKRIKSQIMDGANDDDDDDDDDEEEDLDVRSSPSVRSTGNLSLHSSASSRHSRDQPRDRGCIPQITINIGPSCLGECTCEDRTKSRKKRPESPKMDVLLDVDSVDRSSIKVHDEREEVSEPEEDEDEPEAVVEVPSTPSKKVILVPEPEEDVPEPEPEQKVPEPEPEEVVPEPEPEEEVPEPEPKPEEIVPEPEPEPEDVIPEPEEVVPEPEDVLPEPEPEEEVVKPKKKQMTLSMLPRERTCSSLQFDVDKVQTRLRNDEITHSNTKISEELKKLGVDQLLRACRPAKCCRKAVLNERQKTGLPYSVSLRSLPLVNDDIKIIKDSIDMSVKKIKNSLDLAEERKNRLAYYIALESDLYQPNLNFPWVVPIYSMALSCENLPNYINEEEEEKFYVLKSIPSVMQFPKKVGSEHKRNANKLYILKKPEGYPSTASTSSSSSSRTRTSKVKNVAYKIVKPHRFKSNYLLRRTWKTVGYEEVTSSGMYLKETTSFEDVYVNMDKNQEETVSGVEQAHCSSECAEKLTNTPTQHIEPSLEEGLMKLKKYFLPRNSNRLLDLYLKDLQKRGSGRLKRFPHKGG